MDRRFTNPEMGPIYGGALDLVIFDRVSFSPGPENLSANMYGGGPGGSKGALDFFLLQFHQSSPPK